MLPYFVVTYIKRHISLEQNRVHYTPRKNDKILCNCEKNNRKLRFVIKSSMKKDIFERDVL